MKEKMKTALLSFTMSLTGVVIALIVYDRYYAPHIVVMDVSGYMNYRQKQFVDEYKDKQLTEDKLKDAANEWSLESAKWVDHVAGTAKPNQVIIFKDVVVNNRKPPYMVLDEEADKLMERVRDGR